VQKTYLLAAAAALLLVILAVVTWQQLEQDEVAQTTAQAPVAPASSPAPAKREEKKTAAVAPAPSPATTTGPGKKPAQDSKSLQRVEIAPTFDVVRIDRDGSAVIAGRAQPGSDIKITVDGNRVATGKADRRGEWVVVIDRPLPSGSTELELWAKAPQGREIASETVLAVVVPDRAAESGGTSAPSLTASKATTGRAKKEDEPQRAVAILVPKSGERAIRLIEPKRKGPVTALSVDSLDYGEGEEIIIAGSAPPGAVVRVYVDDVAVGDAGTNDAGKWRLIPVKPIAAGTHFMRVDQLDDAGDVVMRVELPFERMERQVLKALVAKRRVIVQPGNSLWRIARRVYGQGVRYTAIYGANAQSIRDPDLIYPGQVFDLPATE
jgi:nucleoid-associated protein YgaU